MTRILATALLVVLTACGGGGGGIGPPPTPTPTPDVHLIVTVFAAGSGLRIPAARVQVDAGPVRTANAYGVVETRVTRGAHAVGVAADGYGPRMVSLTASTDTYQDVSLTPQAPPGTTITTSGPIFLKDGQPWRWRGVTAFKLARLYADGQPIDGFLEAYRGFRVLRVFDYAVVNAPGFRWDSPTPDQTRAFLAHVGRLGWYVEIVLLTDDDPGRLEPARRLVEALAADRPWNVVFEIGNEPSTNKRIDTSALRSTLDASGFLYSSGDYDDSPRFFGRYGTAHTPRDSEWPRKAHDLLEYYTGGGPNAPTDPAHRVPWVADEPIRPDAAQPPPVMTRADDFAAYFATASILGAGATFHCETCKFGLLPTADEADMARAALRGLNQFPENGPTAGAYHRIDEQGATLRTYQVGPYIVRIRPTNGIIFP